MGDEAKPLSTSKNGLEAALRNVDANGSGSATPKPLKKEAGETVKKGADETKKEAGGAPRKRGAEGVTASSDEVDLAAALQAAMEAIDSETELMKWYSHEFDMVEKMTAVTSMQLADAYAKKKVTISAECDAKRARLRDCRDELIRAQKAARAALAGVLEPKKKGK